MRACGTVIQELLLIEPDNFPRLASEQHALSHHFSGWFLCLAVQSADRSLHSGHPLAAALAHTAADESLLGLLSAPAWQLLSLPVCCLSQQAQQCSRSLLPSHWELHCYPARQAEVIVCAMWMKLPKFGLCPFQEWLWSLTYALAVHGSESVLAEPGQQ